MTLSHFVEPLPCLMEIGVKVLARKLEIQCLCVGVPEDRKVAFYEGCRPNHVSRPLPEKLKFNVCVSGFRRTEKLPLCVGVSRPRPRLGRGIGHALAKGCLGLGQGLSY